MSLTMLWGLSLVLSGVCFLIDKPTAGGMFVLSFLVLAILDLVTGSIANGSKRRKGVEQRKKIAEDTVFDLLDDSDIHKWFIECYRQCILGSSHRVNYKEYFASIEQMSDESGVDKMVIIDRHAHEALENFRKEVMPARLYRSMQAALHSD